jgi:hypothetical protein
VERYDFTADINPGATGQYVREFMNTCYTEFNGL